MPFLCQKNKNSNKKSKRRKERGKRKPKIKICKEEKKEEEEEENESGQSPHSLNVAFIGHTVVLWHGPRSSRPKQLVKKKRKKGERIRERTFFFPL